MTVKASVRELFEPARFPPPPLDGLALSWRYAIAGGFYALYLGTSVLVGARPDIMLSEGVYGALAPLPIIILDLVLGAVGLWVIRWRRRWPFAVCVGLNMAGGIAPSLAIVALWAFISLCSRRDLHKVGIALGVTAAVSLGNSFLPWNRAALELTTAQPDGQALVIGGWVAGVVLMGLVALLGFYYGTRQDRAAGVQDRIDNAERDRELAVLSERNRIAREMHDVLAHRISLVSMHAGVLAFRDDLGADKTREIASIIQENAHASLTELRSVLSTLREAQVSSAGVLAAPQPSLESVWALLDEAQRLGQHVTWTPQLDPATIPAVASRHLYRMLQECLTNARKHAPYAHVEAVLSGSASDGITLHVTNPLAPRTSGIPGAGLGLVGLRERASMLGGSLEAGVVDDEFVVTARLPWPT